MGRLAPELSKSFFVKVFYFSVCEDAPSRAPSIRWLLLDVTDRLCPPLSFVLPSCSSRVFRFRRPLAPQYLALTRVRHVIGSEIHFPVVAAAIISRALATTGASIIFPRYVAAPLPSS